MRCLCGGYQGLGGVTPADDKAGEREGHERERSGCVDSFKESQSHPGHLTHSQASSAPSPHDAKKVQFQQSALKPSL